MPLKGERGYNMLCKFCNSEIGEGRRFCPECGKPLNDETEESEVTNEEVVEKVETDEPSATVVTRSEQTWETPVKPKAKKGDTVKLILLIAGLVAVIGILAVVLLQSFGVSLFPKKDETPEDIYWKEVYSVDSEVAVKNADVTVGKIEAYELDNALLRVFFQQEFETFVTEYYSYLSYVGLDLTKDLAEQTCYFDETLNWEQFMIQASLESWQNYVYMAMLANQNGFTLDAEWQSSLDTMRDSLEKDAIENDFANADAMLKDRYGQTCTVDIYMEYLELFFRANAFYASQLEFSESEIAAAFDENEAAFAEKGITKTSALQSNVRHLLVMPEGGTTGEDGKTTYTEEAWQACLTQAEKLLQEWKDGEATEESFSELVADNTDDTASASTGGLYEGILNDGTYMKEFQDWAVDVQRQPGDTGIVRTTAGYHIMYFVSGEPEWQHYAESLLQNTRFEELENQKEALQNENPVKIYYSKISVPGIF